MKNLKITFTIICILSVLFVLTGCTKQEVTKEPNNEEITSDDEVYLKTLKLKYERKDKEAYDLISKHQDSKDEHIQYLLRDFYYYGYGVEKNDTTAFSWYLKSAEQGNEICQYNVGMFYSEGIGTEQNRELGKQWLEKSALQGYEDALKYLMKNF